MDKFGYKKERFRKVSLLREYYLSIVDDNSREIYVMHALRNNVASSRIPEITIGLI